MWEPGGELARRPGLQASGACFGVVAPGALLVQQVTEPLAELVNAAALVGKQQKPEPFGLLCLLYKQFACVRRGHVHLPFPVAGAVPACGGSLGVGRAAFAWPE